jgi:hypothetical protein
MEDKIEPRWRKSSYSGNGGGSCVEVGEARRGVLLRDTKQNKAGPVLWFTPAVWRRFADQVKQSLAPDSNRVCRRL